LWIERGGRAVAFSACVSDQSDSRLIQTEEMDLPAAVLVCLNPVEELMWPREIWMVMEFASRTASSVGMSVIARVFSGGSEIGVPKP